MEFIKRTEKPTEDNEFYYELNPYAQNPNLSLPNCTCYAWGRFFEATGEIFNCLEDAGVKWLNFAKEHGFVVEQYPTHGAIAVWERHVGIVEEIVPDGFSCSMSGWTNRTQIIANPNYYESRKFWTEYFSYEDSFYNEMELLGFIHPHIFFDNVLPYHKAYNLCCMLYNNLLLREFDTNNTSLLFLAMNSGREEALRSILMSEEFQTKKDILLFYQLMRGSLPSSEECDNHFHNENKDHSYILYSEEFENNLKK